MEGEEREHPRRWASLCVCGGGAEARGAKRANEEKEKQSGKCVWGGTGGSREDRETFQDQAESLMGPLKYYGLGPKIMGYH